MRYLRTALCGLLVGLGAAVVSALDAGDVIQMVQNGVHDSVIINMLNNQKLARPLTANEVMALNSAGASPALLEQLTRPDAAASGYESSTRIVTSPTTTIVEPAPVYTTPTTVVTAPPTIVTAPPTVVTAPPVVYTSPPTYYYYSSPYYRPYYRRPGVSLNFSFGKNRYHGRPGGHHRPRRR